MTDDRAQPDLDAEWQGIARLLARESGSEQERRVREQLPGNEERAALVQALDAALTLPPEPPLSPAEVEAALASVMARRDSVPAEREPAADVIPLRPRPTAELALVRSRWRAAGARAAAAVLVVAGASLVWRATRTAERSAPDALATSRAAQSYATQAIRVDTVKLADGSTVILGPSSRLVLADGYGASRRELTLEGQAFFDVVHDDGRPFIVRTRSATLRDVGTSFSVHSDSARGTRVAVTSGAVDLVSSEVRAGSPTVLHAGDRAEVTGDRMQVERGVVTDEELSWTRGVLVFHDASLTTVAAELRRWYGLHLVVSDSAIATRRLTATFDRGSADDVGRVLAAVLGGSVRRSGDTLRIEAPTSGR
jgi:transmembrane sensor